jgi:hypothetical protein
MIEASQRILKVNTPGDFGGMNQAVKRRHYELQIKTLQNAPRDVNKLERLLKTKRRQKEEAMHIEDTQRLFTEIEMLKVVYCICLRGEAAKKIRLSLSLL